MANETKITELEAKYNDKPERENLLGSYFDHNSQKGIRLLTFCATSDPFVLNLRKNCWTTGDINLNK